MTYIKCIFENIYGIKPKFIAFQLIKSIKQAHSNFITGLCFVPCHTEVGENITGLSEAAVISISVDNQV